MPTKTKSKVKHRVTFAPDTKTEAEQLDCLIRAIEFKGPGIDELSNMIQNIHIGYSGNVNKRKPSFDSTSIIEHLRSTLDKMLDSELAEASIKSSSDSESVKDDVTSKSVLNPTLPTIEENTEKEFKTNHDSGISGMEFDLEKMKNNEVTPQARRRVSGLINKLDSCINELQRVTDTIEEETASEVQAALDDTDSSKETLPPKNGKPASLSIDTSVNMNKNVNINNVNSNSVGNALYCEPNESVGYYTASTNEYLYNEPNMEHYSLGSENEMSRLDLASKGIYATPNQPTVVEACYSGFLLSSILAVVADDCSVLYFGILTEDNLYFYNSTDDEEPMFGRIIIDQNTKVFPISSPESQGYLIEINGVYVMPDEQRISSKVRLMFNNKQERNIWYKVIKTTVNDWKIKTSYVNSNNPGNTGGKRRLSFLSSIQYQPAYLSSTPKRSDSLYTHQMKPATKKSSEISDATLVTPDSADTINDAIPSSSEASPTSATTLASEENYGGVNPSQSILSALHVLEALERKRNNQELKK
ncbi:hypothetical protein BCR36DRAFT_583106 [Piromyces finnis]|uniref:PH domain-containing protein n=1 Tax=Piromyces finnis TaxID=1754191 RepID=A0A1Y1VA53_9FUNG|nr:hypothetical protein BCR36DRAFT_583106 [Piromyces finnis]|eukprot:ORX51037.1 hypothetical protein BCR36DRAFT_583106 [Piromyces finnis]